MREIFSARAAKRAIQRRRVMHSQGDKERDAGNEVQAMYVRAKADKPNAQIGFVEFDGNAFRAHVHFREKGAQRIGNPVRPSGSRLPPASSQELPAMPHTSHH